MTSITKVTTADIRGWNISQVCAALVEAKKIEKVIEALKKRLRLEVEPGESIQVSNGAVSVREPGIRFTHVESQTPEEYLLPAIRPLDKRRARAHYDDTDGGTPEGVTAVISKPSVVVSITG